ncbi:MAG: 50S ribosomal protein L13 [Candidatus Spechtbacterales bacterium]
MSKKKITTKTSKKTESKKEVIELDAKGQILGRLSTEIAVYLQGKHSPAYKPNMDDDTVVKVVNAKKVKVTGKKKTDKIYWHYSGYPGGIYGKTYEEMFEKDPTWVIRKAVERMLPDNRLRKGRMKRLIVEK